MKKYLITLLLAIFIIPSMAFASWWNPFTWKVFNKKEVTSQTINSHTENPKPKSQVVVPIAPEINKTSSTNLETKSIHINNSINVESKNTAQIKHENPSKDDCSNPNAGMETDSNGNITVTPAVFGTVGLDFQVRNVTPGSKNIKLMTVHLTGVCSFKVNHMSFDVFNSDYSYPEQNILTNLKLVDDSSNNQVASTVPQLVHTPGNGYEAKFMPKIIIPTGTTKILSLYADIADSNGKSFIIGNTGYSTTNIKTGGISGIGYDDSVRGIRIESILIGTITPQILPNPNN